MSITWAGEPSSQTLTNLKFEQSPTQSFLSASGSEMYPPLFGGSPAPSTLNPLDVMTPNSQQGDDQRPDYSGASASPEPTSAEKKPVKKRKSWGQVLPEPKTNLPPRKRAKTEDEKEQRRVERVLRNRRAAQSSRERKRQEVEQLEKKNQELLAFVEQIQKQNLALRQENHQLRISSGVAPKSSSSFDALLPAPVTLSSELFGSQSGHDAALSSQATSSSIHQSLLAPSGQFDSHQTVNPASLSPALSPVAEGDESDDEHGPATPVAIFSSAPVTSEKAFPDAMRHPAVSVGGSTSVVAGGLEAEPSTGPYPVTPGPVDVGLDSSFLLSATADPDHFLYESGLLNSPDSSSFEDDHCIGDYTQDFLSVNANNSNNISNPTFDTNVDFNDFLNDNFSTNEQLQQQPLPNDLAGLDASLPNPPTEDSPKDPILQPQLRASLVGCDG